MAETFEDLLRQGVDAARDEQWEGAEDLLERALELKPGNPQAMNMLGYVFWKRGEAKEGEQYYRASLKVNGSDAYARKGLGLCLVEQGLFDEGVGEVKRAIDLRRNWAEPYHDLGVILTKAQRYVEAWPLLDVAVKLNPDLEGQLAELLPQVKARAEADAKAKRKG